MDYNRYEQESEGKTVRGSGHCVDAEFQRPRSLLKCLAFLVATAG